VVWMRQVKGMVSMQRCVTPEGCGEFRLVLG